jgi:hypothetical protein
VIKASRAVRCRRLFCNLFFLSLFLLVDVLYASPTSIQPFQRLCLFFSSFFPSADPFLPERFIFHADLVLVCGPE